MSTAKQQAITHIIIAAININSPPKQSVPP
jgi:hypothetical protein